MSEETTKNLSPIIGVLCVDIAVDLRRKYGDNYYSYIAAAYVKYLESAGARVIPIWINRQRSYYEAIMKKINGILLPGGAVFFDAIYCTDDLRNDCVEGFAFIYDIAKELNESGVHFPLWGTCMGFQLMLSHSAKRVDIRRDCRAMHCSLPVKFENDKIIESSKLFDHIDEDLKQKMSSLPFGVHFHNYCITKADLQIFNIDKQWNVLACNEDDDGLEFISIVEHNNLPFYGSQIHPERVVLDNFLDCSESCSSLDCFKVAQYFATFFVNQCALNGNRFCSMAEAAMHYIHNFPTVLDVEENVYRQYYLFEKDVQYPKELKSLIGRFTPALNL